MGTGVGRSCILYFYFLSLNFKEKKPIDIKDSKNKINYLTLQFGNTDLA
jgi:hypothetical protein